MEKKEVGEKEMKKHWMRRVGEPRSESAPAKRQNKEEEHP